jgi:uncharacterized protein YkwD
MARKFAYLACSAALLGLALSGPAGAAGASLSALIAPPTACPGAGTWAPAGQQRQAMLCMTNFARRRAGLRQLAGAAPLDRSARRKSGDILRCDSFSHEACGRAFTYWMRRVGYLSAPCWRAGENIAWGTGPYATVRSIFTAWIHSPDHRENILGPYRAIGIGMRVGGLEGHTGAHVWTQEFGARC